MAGQIYNGCAQILHDSTWRLSTQTSQETRQPAGLALQINQIFFYFYFFSFLITLACSELHGFMWESEIKKDQFRATACDSHLQNPSCLSTQTTPSFDHTNQTRQLPSCHLIETSLKAFGAQRHATLTSKNRPRESCLEDTKVHYRSTSINRLIIRKWWQWARGLILQPACGWRARDRPGGGNYRVQQPINEHSQPATDQNHRNYLPIIIYDKIRKVHDLPAANRAATTQPFCGENFGPLCRYGSLTEVSPDERRRRQTGGRRDESKDGFTERGTNDTSRPSRAPFRPFRAISVESPITVMDEQNLDR